MFHSALVSPRTAPGAPAAIEPIPAVAVPLPTHLQAITDAYAAGDAPLAEQLLLSALDEGLLWDMVCGAAARGIAARHADGACASRRLY